MPGREPSSLGGSDWPPGADLARNGSTGRISNGEADAVSGPGQVFIIDEYTQLLVRRHQLLCDQLAIGLRKALFVGVGEILGE
jgi:hypothetical protein